MTQMENRIVLTRFKDGYGPVGAYFLHLKTYTENAYGQDYEAFWRDSTEQLVGDYVNHHPVPTCLRNHAFLEEVKAGRGPIRMVTKEAFQDPHKETVGWENFLGMTIGQAVVWASQNIDPKEINPELTTSEPYVMGSHATCSGAWASGPEDYAPAEYQWGYNRMMTVEGLFGAGDAIGGSAHKFSSGSFTEGRIAGKAAVKYVNDLGKEQPEISEAEYEDLKKTIYKPMENLRGRAQRNRRRDRLAELHLAAPRPAAARENHGRICRRDQRLLHDQRTAAYPRAGAVGHAEGRPRPSRGRRPSPAAARVGASPSGPGLGMRDAAHHVPHGNAVAGILLPGRSSEAGRQGLALLHSVPLRSGFREVGDGESSRVSHRRLISRPLGRRVSCMLSLGLVSMSAGLCGSAHSLKSVLSEIV